MTKSYISTRQLLKTQSSGVKGSKYFIVMKHSQPSSILTPYHPDIEKAIEEVLERIEIDEGAKQALEDHKNGDTYTSDEIRKEILSERSGD